MAKFSKGHTRASKLTGEDVLAIRQRYQDGASQGSLARAYGLSVGQIGRIVRNESWQNVSQVEEHPQQLADDAANSLAKLRRMQEAPLPMEEVMAQERGAALLERMGQDVAKRVEMEKELEELAQIPDLPLTKQNPYY